MYEFEYDKHYKIYFYNDDKLYRKFYQEYLEKVGYLPDIDNVYYIRIDRGRFQGYEEYEFNGSDTDNMELIDAMSIFGIVPDNLFDMRV